MNQKVLNSQLSQQEYYSQYLNQMQKELDLLNPAILERSFSLFQATAYGVGIIPGTGIYALIGEAVGITGNAVWSLLSGIVGYFVLRFTKLHSID